MKSVIDSFTPPESHETLPFQNGFLKPLNIANDTAKTLHNIAVKSKTKKR